ncbi:hypothetical protein KUTeg_018498 [Tegillarca granosa]|uniref:Uncharacterized protein n=1 Tax=Tegillarca granosa TaxID=220873 RepID=A0ABQ9EMZ3_TEGGR|nr:hypothetical protein KUTeg_018498 [Tegillarca granosa]
MKTYRIVFLGAEGVGKTSLILQFMNGSFNGKYTPTLEDCYRHVAKLPIMFVLVDNYGFKVNARGHTGRGLFQHIEILDTSGDDQFPVMRELNIRTGDAFVVVFAVDNLTSFYEAQNLCNLIYAIKVIACLIIVGEKKAPVVMVGNKTDLETWIVPTDIAFRAAAFDLNCSFVETSAKCNINVDSTFEILLPNYSETIVDKNSENNKSCLFKRPFRRHSSANILKNKYARLKTTTFNSLYT